MTRGRKMKAKKEKIGQIYYLRNPEEKTRPFAAVAIAKEQLNGRWIFSRGVSICSGADQFQKSKGRSIAFSRLKAAMEKRESFLPIKPDNHTVCNRLVGRYPFKCHYDAQITEGEHRMLFKPGEE